MTSATEHDLELTLEDLREVYAVLALNQQDAERAIQSLELSDDIDDYIIEDEETGLLELRKPANSCFGQVNEDGGVMLFHIEDGEALTRFREDWPTTYAINSGFSCEYEHPEGIVISKQDAESLGVNIQE